MVPSVLAANAAGGKACESTDRVVVVVCSDVMAIATPAQFESAVHDAWPTAEVLAVDALCREPGKLRHVIEGSQARRIVVACRHGRRFREEFVAVLCRAGVSRGAIAVVDLSSDSARDRVDIGHEATSRVRAAGARVLSVDLTTPVRERLAFGSVSVSRRNLFHFGSTARRSVAYWGDERCGSGCLACVESCPHAALSLNGRRVEVKSSSCNGCGACVSACRSAVMSLGGVSIDAFEAEMRMLIDQSRRADPHYGVAIMCTDATALPLGRGWLPLEVPSMEMVTLGWAMQVLAAGVAVRLIGCKDEVCSTRAQELMTLCASVRRKVAAERDDAHHSDPGRVEPNILPMPDGPAPDPRRTSRLHNVTLREPEATAVALSALRSVVGSGADARRPAPQHATGRAWHIDSRVSSIGDITIDGAACSACGRCTLICPSAALVAEHEEAAGFALSFDSALCSACGACVAACPEGVISLRRVIDSSALDAGRRVVAQTAAQRRCRSCGEPIGAGLATAAIAARLAASHPQIAARLTSDDRCGECMLMG